MANLKIISEKRNVCLYLKFTGEIDEDANFSNTEILGANSLDINFQDVTAINSCGVREFYKWVTGIPQDMKINYLNCPEIIIEQFNMVGGLLRKGIYVQSFYIPYFCEKCNFQTMILYSAGKEFTGVNVKVREDVECSKCKGPTEIDVIEGMYFKFLQRQG